MNYNNLCYRCFIEKPSREKACPSCGYNHTPNTVSPNCLLPGMLLHNRYIVGIALGVGGFGITYKCLDIKIGGICAVKEYFPSNYAIRSADKRMVSVAEQNLERYNRIMRRFVEEAELVKKLHHRNIITIYDSFFENNTAYYVMEYCDGIDLRKYSGNFTRRLDYDEGMNILYQIMNGLEYIHSKGILHRDIAPDNIYVTKNNTVKILDFGAARSEMDQLNRELSVIVKVGYAPIEQYGGRGKQGPYTDIYALGATFYHLFTSKIPMESTQRVADDTMEPISALRPDLPNNLKYCIEKAMALPTSQRISSITEMKRILGVANASVKKAAARMPAAQAVGGQGNRNVRMGNGSVSGGNAVPGGSFNYWSVEKASIGARMGAYVIDSLFWGNIYLALLLVGLDFTVWTSVLLVIYPLVFTIINIISELISSTTLGKALFRLHVCGRNGEAVSASQIFLRNIVKLLGIFVVVFGKDDELLQDRAAGSLVCRKKE